MYLKHMRRRNVSVFGATLVVLLFAIEGCAVIIPADSRHRQILITILDEPRQRGGRWNPDFHVNVQKFEYDRFNKKDVPTSFPNAELKIQVQVESPGLRDPLEYIETQRTDNGGRVFFNLLESLPANMKEGLGEETKVRVYFSVQGPKGSTEKVILLEKGIVSKLAYLTVQEKIKNIESPEEAILVYKNFIAKNPNAKKEVSFSKAEIADLEQQIEREQERSTFEKVLENIESGKNLTQQIEILEKFIKGNPHNDFLDDARVRLEELKFREPYEKMCPGGMYDMIDLLEMEDPYDHKGSCIHLDAVEAIQWVPPTSCLCVIRPPSNSQLFDIDPSPSLKMFIEFPKPTRPKTIRGMALIVGPLSHTAGSGTSETALHMKMLD